MDKRLELQSELERLLGTDEVWFQKPENAKMTYPAIIYDYARDYVKYADNMKYVRKKAYSVTVIDYDPDSEISEKISNLEYCTLDRTYRVDNLNHFVYLLYY